MNKTTELPRTITVNLPTFSHVSKSLQDLSTYFSSLMQSFTSNDSGTQRRSFRRFAKKPMIPFAILAVAIVVIGFVVLRNVTKSSGVLGSSDKKITIKDATSVRPINKTMSFPLRDGEKEVGKIKFMFGDAELRDELVIKGQRAIAVDGRQFLVINLKITNEFKSPVEISSRDYVRLISENGERLAPDIHNDPVEIRPISTKFTRLAFPVDQEMKTVTLQIGEINGKKETVKLDF